MRAMIVAVLLGAGGAAHAAPGPCGNDRVATMRVSKLIPGGTAAGFIAAVRDHQAWYASHKLTDDRFVTVPALSGAHGEAKPSSSEFVTFHTYGPTEPTQDAAWRAYVAKYRANSTIVSEVRFCLPPGAVIGR